jgi:PAS domain S-box-containing protein
MSEELVIDAATLPEAPPSAEALRRWQDFYASALQDAARRASADALIRALPEAMPDALLIVDGEGRIALVNTPFELMFGYHRSELIGKTPELLLPPDLRERHIQHRQNYTDDPRSRAMGSNLVLRGRRKNGTEFRVLVMLGPVVTPDGICTIAVIRRVSESARDIRSTSEHC